MSRTIQNEQLDIEERNSIDKKSKSKDDKHIGSVLSSHQRLSKVGQKSYFLHDSVLEKHAKKYKHNACKIKKDNSNMM